MYFIYFWNMDEKIKAILKQLLREDMDRMLLQRRDLEKKEKNPYPISFYLLREILYDCYAVRVWRTGSQMKIIKHFNLQDDVILSGDKYVLKDEK